MGEHGPANIPPEMTTGDNEEIRVARALHAALEADDPDSVVGPFDPKEAVTVDGRFRLVEVARRLRGILAGEP